MDPAFLMHGPGRKAGPTLRQDRFNHPNRRAPVDGRALCDTWPHAGPRSGYCQQACMLSACEPDDAPVCRPTQHADLVADLVVRSGCT